jgi:hypothetical protein
MACALQPTEMQLPPAALCENGSLGRVSFYYSIQRSSGRTSCTDRSLLGTVVAIRRATEEDGTELRRTLEHAQLWRTQAGNDGRNSADAPPLAAHDPMSCGPPFSQSLSPGSILKAGVRTVKSS